jgi:hypothetical protein
MKTLFVLPVIVLALVCGCSKKPSPDAKASAAVEHEEPGTGVPEDPGTATVVSPVAILKGQAKPSQTKPANDIPLEPLLIDRPINPSPPESKKILHKTFSLGGYAQFAFLVPPQQASTRLRGTFRSFTKHNDPGSSDKTADVDLMLLNEQEYNEFLRGQLNSATYELDPAHDQMVDWRVPITHQDPQTYHLVFSNTEDGTKTKFVEADFTLTFE